MINDILDYTQISNGKLRLDFEYFSVLDAVKDVSKIIKFQAKKKGLAFKIESQLDPSSKRDTMIRSDQNRLKQVLLNLLGNALKFTQSGEIAIILSKRLNFIGLEKFENIRIEVKDTGSGIKKDDIPRLFKIFGKIEENNQKKVNMNGVGLGLAISQSLVKMLNDNIPGAEIQVESVHGVGSKFYFELFSRENEDIYLEKEIKTNSVKAFPEKFSKTFTVKKLDEYSDLKNKILVVDDDQINILVASSYLKEFKQFEFNVCYNGKEALEKFKEQYRKGNLSKLILMDCNMPVMDGFEATKRIRKFINKYNLPKVTIVAVTANVSTSDFEYCFKAGMDEYLSKPYTKIDLKNVLDKYNL